MIYPIICKNPNTHLDSIHNRNNKHSNAIEKHQNMRETGDIKLSFQLFAEFDLIK